MRVSAIFAQGGHHGHSDDCDCGYGYGDDGYFRGGHGGHYYNGYNDCHYDYDYDRGDRGLLRGLLDL
ncbi:MAG: hypothetical protein ACRDQU_06580 [Pseudonocardiaceae bacterium]